MKARNDPSGDSKLADIGRWYVTRFVRELARALPSRSRLLDAGAGECQYKPLFAAQRYVSIDAGVGDASWDYLRLDCVGVLNQLPFKSDSFDAVLCTQTLEHLEWPRKSVQEFYRVLKPGGRLYLTAPMAHKEHQRPHDFFRYTSFGLQSICRHAGFGDVSIAPFGGLFVRWAYELPNVLSVFRPSVRNLAPRQPRPAQARFAKQMALLLLRVPQSILLGLDRFDVAKDHPFGWSVVAQK
jgi:SAM-dependent methyltransferase